MNSLCKRAIGTTLLVLLVLTGVMMPKAQAQVNVSVSFQTFYDELSPYGQWVSDPQYGNVWVPNAGPDFRPYGTGGYWAMTEYGNTWVSSYPWGWAPFHYGRWTYDPFYGWIWVPGYEWGPAWVSWRTGGGYYGWAPMSPGITVGVAIGNYSCPADWWVFVGPQYLYQRDYYRYRRGPRYNTVIINQTTIINNTYRDNHSRTTYVIGPRASSIQNVTKRPVPTYRLQNAGRPGAGGVSGNSVSLYRPNVNRGSIRTASPRNAVQAPQAVGRPQPANNRQPAFQNNMRQQQGARPAPNQPDRREPQQMQRQPENRPQQMQQNTNRPEPMNRPQMQRENPRQMRPDNYPQQREMNRPQPMQREPNRQQMQQNFNRPEPQQMQRPPENRPQQMQQNFNRPEPQMRREENRPQMQREMNRPQQDFNRPQPQMQRESRPQPMQQAPMGRPMPQGQPHQGGGERPGRR